MTTHQPDTPHECRRATACRCSISALEPADNCPLHGCGEWPPRCVECGRFLPQAVPQVAEPLHPDIAAFVQKALRTVEQWDGPFEHPLAKLAANARAALSAPVAPQVAEPADSGLAEVQREVARATAKFPTWPTDPLHALAVLGEEFGELTKAALQFTYEPHKTSAADVRAEAVQTAAMALRFLASLDRYEYTPGEQHSQNAAPVALSPVVQRDASVRDLIAAHARGWEEGYRAASPAPAAEDGAAPHLLPRLDVEAFRVAISRLRAAAFDHGRYLSPTAMARVEAVEREIGAMLAAATHQREVSQGDAAAAPESVAGAPKVDGKRDAILKRMRLAMKEWNPLGDWLDFACLYGYNSALSSRLQEAGQGAEPVAWRWKYYGDWCFCAWKPDWAAEPLYAAPKQEAGQDARDAARYRWLREQKQVDIAACWLVRGDVNTAADFDAAIDVALSTEGDTA